MANLTEPEPSPKPGAQAPARWQPDWPAVTNWGKPVLRPRATLLDTLERRQSRAGGKVEDDQLSALLFHTMRLRFRRNDGRFGTWESRNTPAAGGLHGVHLLCLPISLDQPAGVYDEDRHTLVAKEELHAARALNCRSVQLIANAQSGTTIQFVADAKRYESCYEYAQSLIWRDAGAILAILTLVATALDLFAIPLGRQGQDIVNCLGLDNDFLGVGGVHVGSRAC